MPRIIMVALLVTIFVFAGCIGGSGGPGAEAPETTSAPTTDSTPAPATTSFGGQETTASTVTSTIKSTDGSAESESRTTEEYPVISDVEGFPTGGSGFVPQARGPARGEPVLEAGKPVEVTVKIDNKERQPMNYTTIIQIMRLEMTDSGPNVTKRWNLVRSSVSVAAGEENVSVYTITPNMTGGDLRLNTLLYASDPPAVPAPENAYNNSNMTQPAFRSVPVFITNDPSSITTISDNHSTEPSRG